MSQMDIHFLGSGGSWPTPERNVSAIALKIGGEILLLDCGEGTQRQFMRSDVSFMQVSKVFITHFHGDHFLGLPGMLQSMTLNNRENHLEIYGPAGTTKLVNELLHLGYFSPAFEIRVKDLDPGEKADFGRYSVTAFEVNHNVPSYGYVIEEAMRPGKFNKARALELGIPEGPLFSKLQHGETIEVDGKRIEPGEVLGPPRRGRKVVYSGDTRPCQDIATHAKDADVLIHDATLATELEELANERGHSSIRQACNAAKDANVNKLFLTHISPRYTIEDVPAAEEEAKKYFENVEVAVDLMSYAVELGE